MLLQVDTALLGELPVALEPQPGASEFLEVGGGRAAGARALGRLCSQEGKALEVGRGRPGEARPLPDRPPAGQEHYLSPDRHPNNTLAS